MNSSLLSGPAQRRRAARKFTNAVALLLSGLATSIGLFFLGAILWTLLKKRTRRRLRRAVHRNDAASRE